MIEQKIRDLLTAKFQEESFQDCFLVELNLHQQNKLEVFIDCDNSLTHSKCQKISRYLESFIDEKGWLGEKYILEVSSPGIERPLKLKRQYLKNKGRTVKVSLKEGKKKTGVLKEIEEDKIIIEEKVTLKEGKKKKRVKILTEISFENISKAVVKIVF